MSDQSQRRNQEHDVMDFSKCPVQDTERKRTDFFCTLCSGIFALVIFIISFSTFNNDNLKKMTYFVDGDGNLCGWDQSVQDYPLIYFASINDPSKRLCVADCPKQNDKELQCYPTSKLACSANTDPEFQVQIYDSAQEVNRIGGICMPSDSTLKEKVFEISQMQRKYTFLTVYDSIWMSLWLSVVFGLGFFVLYHFMCRKLVHWVFILGSLILLSIGISIIIISDGFILYRLVGGGVMITFGCLIGYSVYKPEYRKQIFVCARLLQISSKIVKHNYKVLLYTFIWIAFQVGLIALAAFQLLCVWSTGPFVFQKQSSFLKNSSFTSNFLSFFVIVELIWGLSFLKQSFNFCVSGYATQWYCMKENRQSELNLLDSPRRLLKYHWGSVAGGSLIIILFYITDLVYDFFFSTDTTITESINRKIKRKPFKRQLKERKTIASILELIRSESFGYINLVPVAYCNASRYCQLMAQESKFYDRSQTTNRLYRISAHVTLVFLTTLISLLANKHTDNNINFFGILFVSIISTFTVTYFVSLHGDLAEGVLVSIFTQEKLLQIANQFNQQQEVEEIQQTKIETPPQEVKRLYEDDLNEIYDGQISIRSYLKGRLQVNKQSEELNEHAIIDQF